MYRGFNGGWMDGGVPFMGNWGEAELEATSQARMER